MSVKGLLTVGLDGQPVILDSFTRTSGSDAWAVGYTVSTQFENDQTDFELRLAVPYVYATDLKNQMVYDPTLNKDGTGSDWFTINTALITAPGIWPMALSAPFTVDCNK